MNVGAISNREVVLADRSATLQEAARLMREHHVGMLLVTGESAEGRHVLGIVTDRDVVIEAVARGLDVARTELAGLLKGRLAAVPAAAGIDEAITAMKAHGVRRLLVAAEDGRVHGVVSLDDVLGALGEEMADLAAAVRSGIEREASEAKPLPPASQLKGVHIPAYAFA